MIIYKANWQSQTVDNELPIIDNKKNPIPSSRISSHFARKWKTRDDK